MTLQLKCLLFDLWQSIYKLRWWTLGSNILLQNVFKIIANIFYFIFITNNIYIFFFISNTLGEARYVLPTVLWIIEFLFLQMSSTPLEDLGAAWERPTGTWERWGRALRSKIIGLNKFGQLKRNSDHLIFLYSFLLLSVKSQPV